LRVFDNLFLYDLGSEDDTFERALRFREMLSAAEVVPLPYTEGLREGLLLGHASRFEPGDWLALVDADELYAEDPRRLLALADAEQADSVTTYQMEYAFTDRDLAAFEREDPAQSVRSRRRYYLIDWSEERFYRYRPDLEGNPFWSERPCSRRLLNRHYQFRSPEQIRVRIRTRLENRLRSEGLPRRQPWAHVHSPAWRDFVRPSRLFHFDDGGPPRFGLPPGVAVEEYRRPGDPFAEELPRMALEFSREQSSSA
jgi:hypothetical protein